jgi:enediyne biosynthesis protein CalE5
MQDDLLNWQRDVWDTMAPVYLAEAEHRLVPCTLRCLELLALKPGERVLDLGTGTGALALRASERVGPSGVVSAVDISDEMLTIVRHRTADAAITNVAAIQGRAEQIPVPANSQDAVAASLSLMFVLDKANAASEIARVLAPGGRFVAAVWGRPELCDVVRFQRIAGSFAPEPPVKGVGPGSMAKPDAFLKQLAAAGIEARVEEGGCNWSHPNLQHAWDTFSSVTAIRMSADQVANAQAAIEKEMWPEPQKPREFRNTALYIVGSKSGR